MLELETHKWLCRRCERSFCQRFPGICRGFVPANRSGAACARSTLTASAAARLGQRERSSRQCPQLLGIDEHFFTRGHGYATTFCDL